MLVEVHLYDLNPRRGVFVDVAKRREVGERVVRERAVADVSAGRASRNETVWHDGPKRLCCSLGYLAVGRVVEEVYERCGSRAFCNLEGHFGGKVSKAFGVCASSVQPKHN